MPCSHCSQKQIADEIGCSQSSISRELKRNWSRGEYKARTAQKKTTQRAKRSHVHTKYEKYDWRFVDASIRCYLSPQQVRGRCKLMNLRCPCVELIYQHIWDDKSWLKRLNSKNSDEVAAAIVEALLPYKGLLKTITSDNGREFADHAIVAKKLGIKYYFAHPYHSWERGRRMLYQMDRIQSEQQAEKTA